MVTLAPVSERPLLTPAPTAFPDDVAEQSVEDAWRIMESRRIAREPRPRSGPPPRCQACLRFVGGDPCTCGYRPGQGYAT